MGNAEKILLFFLLLIFAGCVKDPQDIPGDGINNPVFGLSGQLDAEPIDITAGIDNWTIQPFVEDGAEGRIYTSLLSRNGCTEDCQPSLEFRFYNAAVSNGSAYDDFSETIKEGDKQFLPSSAERDSFAISLSTHPALFMSGFSTWQDLNTNAVTEQNEFASTIGYQQQLNVCFQSLAYTGCQYMQCIFFDPATLQPCISYIEPRLESARYISLTVRPEGTPPFAIEWFNQSTSSTILLPVSENIADVYAGVKVTDANNNISEINQIIRISNGNVDACYFPIHLSSSLVNTGQEVFANRAEINYTDETGTKWSSSAGPQYSQAYMDIHQVDYFGPSPLSQESFKISLSFAVQLFNTSGNAKLFVVEDAVIALAHP